MNVIDLSLRGLKLIRPQAFCDNRGFFLETFRKPLYEAIGISCDFMQDNHSFSKKGTIRGMHFQRKPGQAKLISVTVGKIYDVAVDIRPSSETFGRWEGVYLDAATHEQLFIPVGFAHGFCVISEEAHVLYKVSNLYDPQEECGFRFDDPAIGIKWPPMQYVVSERDRQSPFFRELKL